MSVTTLPSGHVPEDELPIGAQVDHGSLGTGTILDVIRDGDKPTIVEIDFGGTVGVKRLLARYAPLSVVERTGHALHISDQEAFDRQVLEEVQKLEVRAAARDIMRARQEPDAPPFDAGTVTELLARPAEPPMRVEGLMPADGSTLVVAQRKTGKTTLELNLARCLLTGEEFLGRFAVQPVEGTVALLNYEVSAHMIARWAEDAQVPTDRLYVVNLRGRRNPLTHEEDRRRLVEVLREQGTETLIVDPFGRAYNGKSQNDPGEVGAWLVDLDLFARGEVGARDVVLAAHAGWNGERTRGSSALEDWADAVVYLTRDADDESQRFLRAIGRDVEVEEDRLNFDPVTRHLSLTGDGSRKRVKTEKKITELAVLVVRAALVQPGLNTRELVEAVRDMPDAPAFQDRDVSHAASLAERQGLLRVEAAGKGKPKRHFATELGTPSNPVQTQSGTDTPTPSTPSLCGRGGVGDALDPQLRPEESA